MSSSSSALLPRRRAEIQSPVIPSPPLSSSSSSSSSALLSPRRDPIPAAVLYRSFHPRRCRLPPLLSSPVAASRSNLFRSFHRRLPPLLSSPVAAPRSNPSTSRSIPAVVVFLLCSRSHPPPVILSRRHADIHLRQALLGPLGFVFWAPTNVVRYFAEWFCGRPLRWRFCSRPLCWRFCGSPLLLEPQRDGKCEAVGARERRGRMQG